MLKGAASFISDVLQKRNLIYELAKRDFQQQYQGSYLGFVWMFLQPLAYIFILYAVFSLGFRAGDVEEMPFSLYLVTGIIAWSYFADNFSSICGVIKSHAFLVKKVDFRLSVLPLVKIASSLTPHLVLLLVAICLAWYQGYPPSIYLMQLFYYMFSMWMLLFALGLMTSSTSIFVKDVAKIVAILVQFGFWLTPIIWNIQMVPQAYQWIIKLNPAYYIVTGYRDSIVAHVPFWDRAESACSFWLITVVLMFVGISIFRKLRPHFSEVI